MTITDSELLAIEARAKAATGGKWWVDNSDSDVWGVGDSPSPLSGASYPIAQNIIDAETSAFIAHAGGDNGDVLRLVAEVKAMRVALERIASEPPAHNAASSLDRLMWAREAL